MIIYKCNFIFFKSDYLGVFCFFIKKSDDSEFENEPRGKRYETNIVCSS